MLIDECASVGVHIDFSRHGNEADISPTVARTTYRIIQESLTNVVRHAGAGACRVSIDCGAEDLSIEIVDNGYDHQASRDHAPGTGLGLLGMRERVSLLHGDFSAEPRPEGGFRVAARFPVPAAQG